MFVEDLSQDFRLRLYHARAGREVDDARRLRVSTHAARHDKIVEITSAERRLRRAQPQLLQTCELRQPEGARGERLERLAVGPRVGNGGITRDARGQAVALDEPRAREQLLDALVDVPQ